MRRGRVEGTHLQSGDLVRMRRVLAGGTHARRASGGEGESAQKGWQNASGENACAEGQ